MRQAGALPYVWEFCCACLAWQLTSVRGAAASWPVGNASCQGRCRQAKLLLVLLHKLCGLNFLSCGLHLGNVLWDQCQQEMILTAAARAAHVRCGLVSPGYSPKSVLRRDRLPRGVCSSINGSLPVLLCRSMRPLLLLRGSRSRAASALPCSCAPAWRIRQLTCAAPLGWLGTRAGGLLLRCPQVQQLDASLERRDDPGVHARMRWQQEPHRQCMRT